MLEPLTDAEAAMAPGAPELHPDTPDTPRLHGDGNVLRHVRINHGDPDATADVVVSGEYEVGMQDQAFLGPESGLAVPDGEGGVDLYIATQWLHVDRDQVAASLGLPPEKVRLTLGGVGGAFGGREDLSMQIHACMLALHTGAPGADRLQPRGVLLRPRPPPPVHDALRARRHARRAPGLRARADRPRRRRLRVELDRRVRQRRRASPAGPTSVPNARIDAYVVYTNNPPCGAMRGFGAVQVAFAHEAQMDKLAAALDMDPVDLRILNAMGARQPHAHRPARRRAGAGGRAARARAGDADAARRERATCASCPAASRT